jgi:hypothetical protein
MALMPTKQNGPAARSFAADAHDRIMVRINPSYRIQVCSTKMSLMANSPRILVDRQAAAGARSYAKRQKAPSQFIVAARAQASRRCETQATLGGKPPSFATVSVP